MARSSPKGGSGSPTTLQPVAGYTPGAKPSQRGFYLPYSLPAEELALLLEAHASRPKPPPPPPPPGRKRRWILAALLLGLGALGCAIDRNLGFGVGLFSSFMPIGWTAAALVLAGGRARGSAPPRSWAKVAGTVLVSLLFCGGPLAVAAYVYATDPGYSTSVVLGGLGTLAVVLFGLSSSGKPTPPPPDPPRETIQKCAAIVSALADDAMPGKPAVGWLDCTGPEQPEKRCRKGTAANGAEISLYRDEWFRLRLVLRDGNQLRLAAVVRRKVRGHYWKQGRRRRKMKPGRSQEVASIEARLVANPEVWRVKPDAGAARQVTGLSLSPFQVQGDTVSVVGQPVTTPWFEPKAILAVLALLYRQLERVQPGA
jgi:hypothetical protein